MSNPIIVACPKNVWTKVATAVKAGVIYTKITGPDVYYHTYRLTGDPAPTVVDEGDRFVEKAIISSDVDIDVYIYAQVKDGSVRVCL